MREQSANNHSEMLENMRKFGVVIRLVKETTVPPSFSE